MKIGEALKELRLNHEMTQQQVADHLNVSQVTYNRYENNVREPSLEKIYEICRLYKINLLIFFAMLDPKIIHKENTLSVISALMDYNVQILNLKMSSLIFHGLVESDEEYVYVENSTTKDIRIQIENIIKQYNNLKNILIARLSEYDDEIILIKTDGNEIKNGHVYKEGEIPFYMYEIYKE